MGFAGQGSKGGEFREARAEKGKKRARAEVHTEVDFRPRIFYGLDYGLAHDYLDFLLF